MNTKQSVILGVFGMVAAVSHAVLSGDRPQPLHVGVVQGEIHVQEGNSVAHLKCNGFKVKCYESFVVIYVDRELEPSWTDNYVKTIPWSKIEYMTLAPPSPS